VICDGNSNTQVNAIVNSIQKKVSKSAHEKPYQIEGEENAEWVLMDYIQSWLFMYFKNTKENIMTLKTFGAMQKLLK
jgi:ribosome-associated protein